MIICIGNGAGNAGIKKCRSRQWWWTMVETMVAIAATVVVGGGGVDNGRIPRREFALVQPLPNSGLNLAIDASQSRIPLIIFRCWTHSFDGARAKIAEFHVLARCARSLLSTLGILTARASCAGLESTHTGGLTLPCTRFSSLVERSLCLMVELKMATFGDVLKVK